jgi:hypothetical protein
MPAGRDWTDIRFIIDHELPPLESDRSSVLGNGLQNSVFWIAPGRRATRTLRCDAGCKEVKRRSGEMIADGKSGVNA